MISFPVHIPGFVITSVKEEAMLITLEAVAHSQQAVCPKCHQPSTSIHSYYQRSPQDLPISGKRVRLVLGVRRFRCHNATCSQRTFAERFPDVLASYAQRTDRLTATLTHVALEVSSEPGARLLTHVGIGVSPDTLLRLAKNVTEPVREVPRVLGVDDFAFRRSRSYGTLLVDLETHRPVDLLPDRSADTLARWLRAHPGVAYISRDRSNEYTRGANEGAPAAQHITDRWHLLKNLREVLERLLGRVHTQLKHRYETSIGPARPRGKQRRTTKERMAAEMARLHRESRYEEVVNLYRQGTPILRIAEQVHMSRTTVRKFVAAEAFPERSTTLRSKSILDPYVPYLQQRITQGPINASLLWRDVQEQGFSGGYKAVARWLQEQGWQLRKGRSSHARKKGETHQEIISPEKLSLQEQDVLVQASPQSQTMLEEPLESPRHLVWLFLHDPERLGKAEQQMLSFIRQEHTVDLAYTLAQQFVHLLREHHVEELDRWLSTCISSGLSELETFASGLQKESSALRAAIELSYSNGPVEGHVNRLKLIKRSMYNRGSFDLLRQRVLYSDSTSLPLHQSCG